MKNNLRITSQQQSNGILGPKRVLFGNKFWNVLLGLSEGKEQCWSSQAITVRHNSSTLAVDTIVLYVSNNLSITNENYTVVEENHWTSECIILNVSFAA